MIATAVLSAASLFVGAGDVTPVGTPCGRRRARRALSRLAPAEAARRALHGRRDEHCGPHHAAALREQVRLAHDGATIQSAQLGILLALLFFPASTIWDRALFAFLAAMAGTWLFVAFVLRMQARDVMLVPLIGIMFGNVVMGVTGFLAHRFDMTQAMSSWTVGHFSMVMQGRYELVWLAVPLIALAFLFARHFNIVGMGREFSKGLGLSYERILFMGLSIAAMITAAVVTVVGSISYIGLIIPNLVSLFKGDDPSRHAARHGARGRALRPCVRPRRAHRGRALRASDRAHRRNRGERCLHCAHPLSPQARPPRRHLRQRQVPFRERRLRRTRSPMMSSPSLSGAPSGALPMPGLLRTQGVRSACAQQAAARRRMWAMAAARALRRARLPSLPLCERQSEVLRLRDVASHPAPCGHRHRGRSPLRAPRSSFRR